jgi:DNA-binding Lrp family transcriptional regulator
MQTCELDEKTIEILRASVKIGRAKFYSLYKETTLSLASAWRRVKKAIEMKLIEQVGEELQATERGLMMLASLGEPIAIVQLARKYGVSPAAVEHYIKRLNEFYIPLCFCATLADTIRYLNVADLYILKNTPAEALAAKLFLQYCEPCAVRVDGNKYILGNGYVVAAYCELCDKKGRYELFPSCPHLDRIFSEVKRAFINRERA